MSNNQERIEELKKQRAAIDKELNILKGIECREGRVSVYKKRIYIGSVEERDVYGLAINRISEYNPKDDRKMGIFYAEKAELIPAYIKSLVEELISVLGKLERGEFNFE